PKSQRSYAPAPKPSFSTRSNVPTRHKGKEIAKLITPPFESGSDEDSDPEQAQKDKEMQNNFALIAKYFKNLYKPTNNNLRTYSNSRNKTVDNSPRNLGTLLRNAGSQSGLKTTQQVDWIEDTDEEIDEHELEAHYSFVAKIQKDLPKDSNSNDTPLE
nr:hypothetical protein [Tanacetum cinerariifolium]